MSVPLIYIAGPYSDPDPHQRCVNIHNAWKLGTLVASLGAMPVVPHKCSEHMDAIQPAQFWIDATLQLMRRCDAVLFASCWMRSAGARGEHAEAERRQMPIFYTLTECAEWLLPPEECAKRLEAMR